MANLLSIARILLSGMLFVFDFDYNIFLILYSICGITDLLDGYIARKTKTESVLGSKLDSIGDFLLGIVILKVIYPILFENMLIIVWVSIIAIMKVISIIIAVKKYRTIAIRHTFLNKITGAMMFLYVYMQNNIVMLYLICVVAMITAIEEIMINIKSKELNLNTKTLFVIKQ